MFTLKRYTEDLINLIFPELCNGCGHLLYHGEKEICTKCLFDLPYTDFHLYQDNPVAKQFWGRIPLDSAMAMLFFKKGTKVQNLIHSLKYKDKTDIGVKLGSLLGQRLLQNEQYASVDVIIPVPLHQKKLKLRGYNQSEYIANGLSATMNKPLSVKQLVREISTESQTKKSRYSRFENMQEVFKVINPEQLEGKHVLLIDDVITTGATLEACGDVLLNNGIKNLSIATIAFAE